MKFYDENADMKKYFEILAFHDKTAGTFEELDKKLEKTIQEAWNGRALPFPILLDSSGSTIQKWGIHAFPTVVLIDPKGRLVKGGSEELLQEYLDQLRKRKT